MTAAAALDLVNADISKWARVLDNAKKIKASRMVAKAELRLAKLERIRAEWIAHSALSCTTCPTLVASWCAAPADARCSADRRCGVLRMPRCRGDSETSTCARAACLPDTPSAAVPSR